MKQNFKYYARQLKNSAQRLFVHANLELNPMPVIITGNQKSGTSAIAALLSKATGEEVTIDVFAKMGRAEYDILDKKVTFMKFRESTGKLFMSSIIKEPEFIFFMKELFGLYPMSKFVYIIRAPIDNIRSILNRLSPAKNSRDVQWADIEKACRNTPLWKLVFDSSRMPYTVDGIIATLAHRWVYAYEQLQKHLNKLYVVSYEDFKANKELVIANLANELGIHVKHSIKAFMDIQYQPAGHMSNSDAYFCDYDKQLINGICGDYTACISELSRYGKNFIR